MLRKSILIGLFVLKNNGTIREPKSFEGGQERQLSSHAFFRAVTNVQVAQGNEGFFLCRRLRVAQTPVGQFSKNSSIFCYFFYLYVVSVAANLQQMLNQYRLLGILYILYVQCCQYSSMCQLEGCIVKKMPCSFNSFLLRIASRSRENHIHVYNVTPAILHLSFVDHCAFWHY